MLVIDGSLGEGGGQILRTTLSLAMCLGKPVRIDNIRAGRRKPGLLRQHLTCLHAAKSICQAQVSGDKLGSSSVSFTPGNISAGEYHFAVGSAGSSTLVLQTVLPALLLADGVSELTLEGGTHNGMAPSFEFLRECYLPVLLAMGCEVEAELQSYGFYPAGGGRLRVRVHPASSLKELNLNERGEFIEREAVAISSRLPGHVTERELKEIHKLCGWSENELNQKMVRSAGPGNMLSLRLSSGMLTEVIDVVGERKLSAEAVAHRAIEALRRYEASGVPVGEYLADQLLLPMALGRGGVFITMPPSQHTLTNIEVITAISGIEITARELSEQRWKIAVDNGLALV